LFSEEGATPTMAASLLAHMKPPGELPEPVSEKTPGYFEIEVAVAAKEAPAATSCNSRRNTTPIAAIR